MAKGDNPETPLLRVSRAVSACQRCRNAKVKCDGKLPACTACEKAGRSAECSSANDQFARGKERSYVASLETQVERLERQIIQAKARRTTVNALDLVSAERYLAPPLALRNDGAKVRRKEAQNVNDLVSDFGFLSVNATARDFHGFTEQMSFGRLVLSASSVEAPLIGQYLENIHTLYPFLSETKLFAAIDAVYHDNGRYPHRVSPMDHWTTRMVLAIALASISRRRGDTQYQDAVHHAAGALAQIEVVVQPGSVSGIQAMLLLVLYAMFDPHHFNSWYLIGLASRAMIDIGLHQDPPKEMRLRGFDLEIRRRVYASIYSLDRSISMVHLRGFSFTDDSASVTSPFLPPRRNGPLDGHQIFLHSFEPAAHLDVLRQIQSLAYQELFQANRPTLEAAWPLMSKALSDVHCWSEGLSGNLDDLVKRMFRSDVLYSSILILSPPGLVGRLCDYGKFLVFEYAVQYSSFLASNSCDQEISTICTYNDVLRASFVAERLLSTLYGDTTLLFSGIVPEAPQTSRSVASSCIVPTRTVGEMVITTRGCLDNLEKSLEYLGSKYGYEPLNKLKAQSAGIQQTLEIISDNWNRTLGIGPHRSANTFGIVGLWNPLHSSHLI